MQGCHNEPIQRERVPTVGWFEATKFSKGVLDAVFEGRTSYPGIRLLGVCSGINRRHESMSERYGFEKSSISCLNKQMSWVNRHGIQDVDVGVHDG